MSSLGSSAASLPDLPSETSRGSSVSSDLQKEYEDILKYALVTPRFEVPSSAYSTQPAGIGALRQGLGLNHHGKDFNLSTIVEAPASLTDVSSSEKEQEESFDEDLRNPNYDQPRSVAQTRAEPGRNINMFQGINMVQRNQINESPSSTSIMSPSSVSNDGLEEAVDQDLIKMENLMDEWCLELKRNVLGEFSSSKLKLLDRMQQKMDIQKKKHFAEENALLNQIENQKELLHTFEKSIHQKDVVITNLTNALQKQKEKHEKLKVLLTWKLKHNDEKREEFASKMARKHFQRSIMSKAWLGWRSVIEMRWKQRVERACQARSQEVCIKLTEDYEERLKGMQKSLEAARLEVARLHSERDHYEETMKKAFMRGVCALNMEAMSMFKEAARDENEENHDPRDAEFQPKDNKASHDFAKPQAATAAPRMVPNQEKVMHVRAVGKEGFKSKATKSMKSGKGIVQPSITSVYVEKHNLDEKGQASKSRQPMKPKDDRRPFARDVTKTQGRGLGHELKVVE